MWLPNAPLHLPRKLRVALRRQVLTDAMDSHDISRGRGDYHTVLQSIMQPVLVLGIDSDVLYPIDQQEELRDHITNAEYAVIHSKEGHDGFLLEQDQVSKHISHFLQCQQDGHTSLGQPNFSS